MTFCFIKTSSQNRILGNDTNLNILCKDSFCSDYKVKSRSWEFMKRDGSVPGKVPCGGDVDVPDGIPSAHAHTVYPAKDAGKQQTSYLFGKENIHQAMI